MCGIFGFAGFEKPDLLQRMAEAVRHRIPDGEGYFSHGRFSMGTRRLSIIDLEGGDQPIYNEDRSLAVCVNGEIDNYLELREELEARGPPLRQPLRHRGDRPRLRAVGRGCAGAPERHVIAGLTLDALHDWSNAREDLGYEPVGFREGLSRLPR